MRGFWRVQQFLGDDSGRVPLLITSVTLVLLAAWVIWACCARVTRYELSDSARLEIDSAVYPVQANISGKLAAVNLRLGRHVEKGDVLLEFESDDQRLTLEEQKAHLAALAPQLAALQAQSKAEEAGRSDERKALQAAQPGAEAQAEQASAEAALAEQEYSRAEKLRAEKLISEAEAARAKAAAQSKRAAADSLRAAALRLKPDLDVRQRDRDIKSKQTLLEVTKLEGEMAIAAATVRRLQYEQESRRLRAPASGSLAECAPLHLGSYVSEGDKVGVILPKGKLQVVAQFQPSAALGKVHYGQSAVLRLQGFPWAQYGTLGATVSRVADEIRDGKVRVELELNGLIPPTIPAQHGLPGSVEIEIERVSPAMLVLRSAGEVLGGR